MKLTIIGSGTVSPSAERASPSYLVEHRDISVLLDCGAGMLHRAALFGICWQAITHVVISHFHTDHWGELPAFLLAQRWGGIRPRAARLSLIGPRGLQARLEALDCAFGGGILDPGFPLAITEVDDGVATDLGVGMTLRACTTPHTDESLAFALDTGSARLVYTGDTGPSDSLADWATGCSLLLCECSLPESHAVAIHLTPRQAGELARRAAAGMLVMTHFYPITDAVAAVKEAAEVYQGEVVAASDGQEFFIGVR